MKKKIENGANGLNKLRKLTKALPNWCSKYFSSMKLAPETNGECPIVYEIYDDGYSKVLKTRLSEGSIYGQMTDYEIEYFIVLKGRVRVEIDDEDQFFEVGDGIKISKLQKYQAHALTTVEGIVVSIQSIEG
jgi:mannose-6-phosphate isomerase-like protein (cupin superfamily)